MQLHTIHLQAGKKINRDQIIFKLMKQILTRIDTTLLILLSASIVLIEFNERNSTFFLAWLLILILVAFFVLVLIYSFVRSYYSKLLNPTLLRFLPFAIGLI